MRWFLISGNSLGARAKSRKALPDPLPLFTLNTLVSFPSPFQSIVDHHKQILIMDHSKTSDITMSEATNNQLSKHVKGAEYYDGM